jgi:5'-3' exonuclease
MSADHCDRADSLGEARLASPKINRGARRLLLTGTIARQIPPMRLHLVDGTFELYRAHFGSPPVADEAGRPVGATRGLLRSLYALVREPGVTHVAVAFDHVIESFRNNLFDGYKTSEGVPPELFAQFPLAERASRALGLVTWGMEEFEADDALATAAARWADAPGVEQVVICSPDKDLTQCVRGERVVTLDRIRKVTADEPGVHARMGVAPPAVPDLLALVGDDADGVPGIPRWGMKSAATLLNRYGSVDAIPADVSAWDVPVRGAAALSQALERGREAVGLYRLLTTLRRDVPLPESLEDLRWRGADREALVDLCAELGDMAFVDRVAKWR